MPGIRQPLWQYNLQLSTNSYSKEGYFNYLTAYVGVGYSVDCPPGCFAKSGGMLMYTREEEKWSSIG